MEELLKRQQQEFKTEQSKICHTWRTQFENRKRAEKSADQSQEEG